MANRIVLYKNSDYASLSDGWHLLLESLNRFVPGAKMESLANLAQLGNVLSPQKQGIVVVPLAEPKKPERLAAMQRELQKQMPYPFFFAMAFLLIENAGNASTVLEKDWIHTLDSFYDQAIPVQFIYCPGADADAHTFNIAASLSSLLRQLDSLAELRKLNEAVVDLEKQIKSIQAGLK